MEDNKSFNIMVTDLNHHFRHVLIRELERDGYSVCSMRNGIKVCDTIRTTTSLDLVILDPELIYPYGLSLLWDALQKNNSIKIIIHTDDENINEGKAANNVHIIRKENFNIGLLKGKIKACLKSEKDKTTSHN